jgi:hypothetical protein
MGWMTGESGFTSEQGTEEFISYTNNLWKQFVPLKKVILRVSQL